jgi:predicted metal-dependent peptidase
MDNYRLVENIIACKIEVLQSSTFFGLLMQHLKFAIDSECPTACTDGERIYFGTHFCDDMPRDRLTVVMMHELMHIVLGHCFRVHGYNRLLYNIAADIVVNSTLAHIMGLSLDVKGEELIHLAPDGKEGYLYTAEDVYEMLLKSTRVNSKDKPRRGGASGDGDGDGGGGASDDFGDDDYDVSAYEQGRLDDHSTWQRIPASVKEEWQGHLEDAARTSLAQGKAAGRGAMLAERFYTELTHPTINWRLLLQNFIQTDVVDYSFMPPDRRYGDFFLPDFSEPSDSVKNLWIVMDTSGSITNRDMARAFSEIKGGIDQFGGALHGKLSFFDAKVTDPVDFENFDDILDIVPVGGGGTNFHAVFDYYRKHLHEREEITGIIIFTDGYAIFPPEALALGTPVFWLINNALVTPPWGVVARYLP